MLAYAGKSSQELDADKRFPPFLRSHVSNKPTAYWIGGPSVPSKDVREFLSGLSDDVRVVDGRYVTGSGCPAHDCTENGLLWVDTATGATVYAASLDGQTATARGRSARLWMFSNAPLTAGALPPPLLDAIGGWTQYFFYDK